MSNSIVRRLRAHDYRLLIAAAILKLFAQENGREATSVEELAEWKASQGERFAGPIYPYAILTHEEIVAVRNRRCAAL